MRRLTWVFAGHIQSSRKCSIPIHIVCSSHILYLPEIRIPARELSVEVRYRACITTNNVFYLLDHSKFYQFLQIIIASNTSQYLFHPACKMIFKVCHIWYEYFRKTIRVLSSYIMTKTKILHRTSYVVYAICIMPSMPKYYVSVTTHAKRRQIKDILMVSADQDQRTSFF